MKIEILVLLTLTLQFFEAHPSLTKYPHNCIRAGFYGIDPFQGGLFGATAVKATATGQYIEVSYLGKNARLVYLKDPAGGVVSVFTKRTVIGSSTPEMMVALISCRLTAATDDWRRDICA